MFLPIPLTLSAGASRRNPELQPIPGEKGPIQRVRRQFVPKVHMRIAATCLSLKQAVGYAADPGRAVGRVAHGFGTRILDSDIEKEASQ